MSVWDDVIGQETVIEQLRDAAAAAASVVGDRPAAGMTHAWLFTGPPGSGRSNAAVAFAAALQCDRSGCGECLSCRTSMAGSTADITRVTTQKLSIGVDEARELVRKAALSPAGGRWQIMIVEDADRLTDQAADALLKSIEEPTPRTVWLLCAPTLEDVVPTIRSRCRSLVLRTPSTAAVTDFLVARAAVQESVAAFAARASQGHIGRARALASDEAVRNRRRDVLRIPGQLADLGSAITVATNVVEAAGEEAQPRIDALNAKERGDLQLQFGVGSRGAASQGFSPALKELERAQKARAKRLVRDAIDRCLVDLASFYRDVLAVQFAATTELVNEELRDEIESFARRSSSEESVHRLSAIFDCRERLEGEVAPQLALEALMISLMSGD